MGIITKYGLRLYARIPPAPAFRPCVDVGMLDEQPRWVDVMIWKLEPVCNEVEVPPDQVAQPHQAVVVPSVMMERRAASDSVEYHQRFVVRGVRTVP